MRPIADIMADEVAEPPTIMPGALDAWETYCARISEAELADLQAAAWLAFSTEYRARVALVIPASLAADPRYTSPQRYVLAALAELERDLDITQAEAMPALRGRLFGPYPYESDLAMLRTAIDGLVRVGSLRRTRSGGWVRT